MGYLTDENFEKILNVLNSFKDDIMFSQHRRESADGNELLHNMSQEMSDEYKKLITQVKESIKTNEALLTQKQSEKDKAQKEYSNASKDFNKNIAPLLQAKGLTKKEINNEREKYKQEKKDNVSKKEEEVKQIVDAINRGNTTLTQIKSQKAEHVKDRSEKLDKEAKYEVFNKVTGGRHGQIERSGNDLTRFGNALTRYGINSGKKGTLGALGMNISKLGNSLSVGKLNMVGAVSGAIAGVASGVLDFATQQQQFKTQQQAIENQRQLALTQSEGEMAQAKATRDITISKNNLQTQLDFEQGKNAIVTDARAAATEIGLQSMTDIVGGAFAAGSKQIQIEASLDKLAAKTDIQSKITTLQNKLALQQYKATKNNTNAVIRSANVQADTAMEMSKYKQAESLVDAAGGALEQVPVLGDGLKIAHSAMAYGESQLEYKNQQLNFDAQMNQTRTNIQSNLQNSLMEGATSMEIMQLQNELAISEQNIDEAARKAEAEMKFGQEMFNAWQKSETAAYAMGHAFNYNEDQLLDYAKTLSHTAVTVSKWGKTMEDMEKLQSSFQETTGRNRHLSEKDFDKSFANGMLVGDDVVSQLNSGMEIFHMSVADSNDMFYDMYKQVTKMGLSGKKFGKDLVQNLKLAEKYDFKGGVESLMKMSKWAQNMRFNVNSLDGMLNKVQEGGLQGIIQQSAELQVLGGNFAMGADPLAMAYESFADPEAYAKRIAGMVGGMGHLNNKGQAEFGISENIIMRQAAKSLGMDYNDLRKIANQQLVTGQIKDLVTQDFDEDQLAAIANNATYKDGKWVVNDANGQVKEVSQLTAADVEGLSGKDNEGTVEENVAEMRSTAKIIEGTQTNIQGLVGEKLWSELHDKAIEMGENVDKAFQDNMSGYLTNVQTAVDNAVEAQKKLLVLQQDDKELGKIGDKLNNISNLLSPLTDIKTKIGELKDYFTGESSSSNLETFALNMRDEGWLNRSLVKGTKEFNIMKNLYENLDTIMEDMKENTEYYNPNSKKYTSKALKILFGIQAWNPTGDVTTTSISQEHLDTLSTALGYYSEEFNIHGYGNLGRARQRYWDEYKNDPNKQALFDNNNNDWADNTEEEWKKRHQDTNAINAIYEPDSEVLPEGYIKQKKTNDGIVYQNGSLTRIDNNDQVLAAKENGPIDKMLDMVRPQPMSYDTYVKENPYGRSIDNENVSQKNDKIEIAPISININGNIKVNGDNIDITSQISNDPLFKDALWKLISVEVAKRVDNSGRLNDPLYNRIQNV
jgi:hypothetical protein